MDTAAAEPGPSTTGPVAPSCIDNVNARLRTTRLVNNMDWREQGLRECETMCDTVDVMLQGMEKDLKKIIGMRLATERFIAGLKDDPTMWDGTASMPPGPDKDRWIEHARALKENETKRRAEGLEQRRRKSTDDDEYAYLRPFRPDNLEESERTWFGRNAHAMERPARNAGANTDV
ncbi:hypothetical protein PLICRDRAFT_42017 [Plicaturopsis crispa FD-325 SS-3]|nr:hypothetical protein PLICRDRAFT_42017 [Plicaturopsis crispa FD-325 SS-3]